MSRNLEIGRLGEETACKFLMKRDFEIIERNYLRKYGEIDIVALKGDIIHFVEVKTVSRENIGEESKPGVIRETGPKKESYRPEDNVHPWKIKRMRRVIQAYLADKEVSGETDWQFDVITVLLDTKNKKAKVELLDNIVL